MKKFLLLVLSAMTVSTTAMADDIPAFPGAEGHGRYITGGRGKTIVHVTNLKDSGTGSFRSAVSSGNRIVVFDVGGVIELKSDLNIKSNITILGQTAPSPGITLRYRTVRPNGNNIIMRFIRIRRGEEKDINDGADATWAKNYSNMMLDHCSFSWSIDEIASFYDNCNFTMQWCTLGEALANPGHSKGEHSYGGIWGGKFASFHHNFLCHMQNRVPRFCGARYEWTGYDKTLFSNPIQAEIVDLRNCVMYNWGNGNGCYGGTGGGNINIVNNYYKAGPATTNKTRVTQVSVATDGNAAGSSYMGYCARYFINGNYVTAAENPENYDWNGVIYDSGTRVIDGEQYCPDAKHLYGENVTYKQSDGTDCVSIKLDEPVATGDVTTHLAQMAYEKVLAYGGASLYRDAVDTRYMDEAANGKTTYTGSATKTGDGKTINHLPGIIDFVKDQGTYTLESTSRPEGFDSDNDGIPDAWETANGLNPNDASDANTYTLDEKGWYTNIEVYANSLVQDIMLAENKDALSAVKEYYPKYVKEDGTVVPAINDGKGFQGNITWNYNDGNSTATPTYSADFTGAFSTQITTGTNITADGILENSYQGIKLNAFKCNSKDAEANDNNAVKFGVTPNSGFTFQPTSISFKVARNKESSSSSGGSFSAYWIDGDGNKTTLEETTVAERINRNPYVTEVTADIVGATPTSGTSTLVINLFNFMTSMPMGISDIVINGMLSKGETAINTIETATEVVSTTYYSLDGRQLNEPQQGINIRVEHLSNGQKVATKVIK